MEDESLYHLLVETMEGLAVKVVRKNLHDDEFRIHGGLCKVRGQDYLYLDQRLPLKEQIAVLIRGLAQYNLEEYFIPPIIRVLIEQEREGHPEKFPP